MKKIFYMFLGALSLLNVCLAYAAEKFDILPDLPEALATAQAASVSTSDTEAANTIVQSVGQEPNWFSVIISLGIVILLVYVSGIVYTKLNKIGLSTFKKQMGDTSSRVAVVSTTALGGNKTLHVVELDGKRMLIGASASSIQLLKDLGSYPPEDFEQGEFSKIEIPNIRIPKIEIPKIEFPNIGFTKAFTNLNQENSTKENSNEEEQQEQELSNDNDDSFEISEIYEEGPDGIIDKLFQSTHVEASEAEEVKQNDEHKVDPEEYALYKKYL